MEKNKEKLLVIIIFLFILLAGLSSYKDYGVSSDELNNRLKGTISLNYIGEKFLPSYIDNYKKNFSKKNNRSYNIPKLHEAGLIKYYGVTFDLPLYALELLFNINETYKKYQLRHVATFLIFFVALIYFYKLAKLRTNNVILSSTAVVILFLTPRILANSFYNSKDIVFLSFFFIAIYYSIKFFKKQSNKNIILAGLTCAIAIDTRIAGVILPFFITVIFILESLISNQKLKLNELLKFYLILFLFVIIFWPYLWENPILNFIEAYNVISKYPIEFNFIFNEKFISVNSVPYYYYPYWILISTPILNLILFLTGFIYFLKNLSVTSVNFDLKSKQDIFIFLIFSSILFVILFLDVPAYDGWRHFYFLYPLIVYFILVGMLCIFNLNYQRIKKILFLIIFLAIIHNIYWVIKNHPHQNVYFNILVSKNDLSQKVQLDYWGLSYKQNLKKIFEIENNSRKVKIYNLSSNKLVYHSLSLEDKHRDRIEIVKEIINADYVLDNFNYRAKPDKKYLNENFYVVNEILSGNQKINLLYKRK